MSNSHRIKVLYITAGAHLYGDNRSLLNTLKVLKNRFDILVCVTAKGLFSDELEKQGIPNVQIAGTMTPKYLTLNASYKWLHRLYGLPRRMLIYYKTRKQLDQIIRSFHPDIIHTNNSIIYAGARMAHRFHIPHVWHLREYIDLDHQRAIPDKNFFEKECRRSHCIAITRGIFDYRQLSEPKDTQIYNGVFMEKEVPPYQPAKQKVFLFLGRITPTKGLDDLIDGFAHFLQANPNYRDYVLNIVGEGDQNYVAQLKTSIQSFGIADNVHFLGFHSDVRPMLLSAKALIVPSLFEGMGRITAEAMLIGCFVIGRDTGGTRELLTLENAGITFSDNTQLTEAMALVADYTDEQLIDINMAVRNRAIKHYTAEVNAQAIACFYQRILGQNH